MFCEMIMGLGSIQMPTYTTTIDMGYRLWNDMLCWIHIVLQTDWMYSTYIYYKCSTNVMLTLYSLLSKMGIFFAKPPLPIPMTGLTW